MRSAVVVSITLLCLSLAYYAFRVEPAALHVAAYDVTLPAEMKQASGLRIAFLADFHAIENDDGREDFARSIHMANALHPDLILLGGDYMRTRSLEQPMDPQRIASYLAQFKAPLGIYAILGNGDWRYGGDDVIAALRSANIQVIENQAVVLSNRLAIVGISDHATWQSPDSVNVKKAFSQLPATHPYILALTHSPRIFPYLPASVGPLVMLAGHTHNYQVNVPAFWKLVSVFMTPEKYLLAHGTTTNGMHQLIVTSGVGTGRVRVRFNAKPEIVLITLR